MKRMVKLFSVVGLAILAGLVLKSDRGHGQTAGSQSPIIIERVVLKNQTAGIGPTALFTPTVSGLYRISTYVDVGPPSNDAQVCGSLSWNDDFSAHNNDLLWYVGGVPGCAFYGPNGEGSNVLVIHAAANQPVTFGTSSGRYGVYTVLITVEQL
ncbi:MAG TPA: hypothetical protein VG206_21575 [Terriglobia bacterium]|nr:hypothetical protein [Terriglobia bacterium]